MDTEPDQRIATWTENTLHAVHLAHHGQPLAGASLLARVLIDGQQAAAAAATALTVYLADWFQRRITLAPGAMWGLNNARNAPEDAPGFWAMRVLAAHLNGDTPMMAAHYASTHEQQWAPRVHALFDLAVDYLPRWEEQLHAAAAE